MLNNGMVTDRCFYFAKAGNELDLASFRLSENSVEKTRSSFAADRHEGRPDLLSHEIASDWELWWAVLRMNAVEDPFNDVERGMVIETPSAEWMPEYFKAPGI